MLSLCLLLCVYTLRLVFFSSMTPMRQQLSGMTYTLQTRLEFKHIIKPLDDSPYMYLQVASNDKYKPHNDPQCVEYIEPL